MQEIEIIEEESNVYGYRSLIEDEDAFDYMGAFFSLEQISEIKSWLKKKQVMEFVVLRNVYVDDSNRGQGLGKSLVKRFLIESKGNPVILIASPDEEFFELTAWYENLGFELTKFICADGPLMIKF